MSLSGDLLFVCIYFVWQLSGEGLLESFDAFVYVDDLMVVFPTEHNFELVS